jgi:hypothetical protein
VAKTATTAPIWGEISPKRNKSKSSKDNSVIDFKKSPLQ